MITGKSLDLNNTTQNPEEFLKQGLYKAQEGDYRGAIADFNQVLRINPNSALAYHNRGVARFKLEETQASIRDFTQAIRLDTNYIEAYVGRGNAYRKLRDLQGAIIDYSQLLRFNSQDAKAYYNRGVAYSELGEKRKAVEDYQKALKLFYEQGDEVNGKRTWENLAKLQPQAMPPKSAGTAAKPFNFDPSIRSQKHKLRFDQASRELQDKLMRLVQGDDKLAVRLLSQVKINNPGRSVNWYVEKVIYDLERDRGR